MKTEDLFSYYTGLLCTKEELATTDPSELIRKEILILRQTLNKLHQLKNIERIINDPTTLIFQ